MRIKVRNRCSDYSSYRAARVKSLFNAEKGCNFDLDADLPIDDVDWCLGVIVGPSGSGKTSIGRTIWGGGSLRDSDAGWPSDTPIIDAIAPDGDFDAVTGSLSAVGLGDVPSWLRPYSVLSNGEKFRADLARLIAEPPDRVVVDEFSSVIDRQIAKFGSLAFSKAWRRTGGKCVLLSCHYDILDWLEPDWVFDAATGEFSGRWLRQGAGWFKRPKFDLEVWQTDWRHWPEFEPHHYLKLPKMVAARCYIGTVDGERVCHVAVGSRAKGRGCEARACRLVVKPEWQGAGVGTRFLNAVCELQLQGDDGARLTGRSVTTLFHTTHPGLCSALRRDKRWRQISAVLHGGHGVRSQASLKRSGAFGGKFGGHLRAVQGFRYYGRAGVEAYKK